MNRPAVPSVATLMLALLATMSLTPAQLRAQLPVVANPNHEALLASGDPRLAAHKRLVYDFWREVLEAGHVENAEKYLTESYIQHNPTVPTGRAGFVQMFSRRQPRAVEPRVRKPLVAITAEGDLVVLSFVQEYPEPGDTTKRYTTTWFDMFRIENGKIAEHWDSALKR